MTYSQFICDTTGGAYDVQALSLSNGSDFWYESFPGISNDSGVRVNGYTALGNCNVWKALNVLAGDMGQLPVKLFRKQGGKSVEVENEPEIDCLRTEPNPWTLPSIYKETAMWVAALWGNSVSWVRRPTPNSIQLVPLCPDRVGFQLEDELTGNYFYTYTSSTGAKFTFDREEVCHVPGLSTNGIWGLSLLDVAKNCIGQGLVIEKHINKSFANGNRPSGVLKMAGRPHDETVKKMRAQWNEIHQGGDNAGKIAILVDGLEYQAIAATLEQSQADALRRLDREMVASLFNLPLFKLNSMEHSSTRSNLEQQQQEYLTGSLMRWLNRFKEEWERKILSREQRKQGYYYRWITEALLRGDTAARFSSYGVAIQNRIMNPNEAREKEDMEPYEGGEEFGNPNIDPKAQNDASNAGGRPPGSKSADALIERRISDVITAESEKVQRSALDSSNFLAWIDSYYGVDGSFDKLVQKVLAPVALEVCDILPGYAFDSISWGRSHAAESKRLLLKMCDQTTKARLSESVKAECETWNTRAKQCE